MDALIASGHDMIVAFQTLQSPFFDLLFAFLSFLGNEEFLLFLIPTFWWTLARQVSIQILVIFLCSTWLNNAAKEAWAQPRPFDPRVNRMVEEDSYGIPSGHAQSAMVIWGYIGMKLRTRYWWALPLCGLLIFGIGLSRIYNGVHFPHDVVVGWLLGAFCLMLGTWLLPVLGPRFLALPWPAQAALGLALSIILTAIAPNEDGTAAMGVLGGVSIALPLEWRLVRFDPRSGTPVQMLARVALGGLVLFALWIGLKQVFPEGLTFRFIRYIILGLWTGLLAPWIFVQLGLAQSLLPTALGDKLKVAP
jgi:membrane-associated phospholipid phosphatase